MTKYWATFIVLFLSVMLLAPKAHAVTCDSVASSLQACSSALQKGGTVSSGCCSGIKSLSKSANTPAARKTVCQCVRGLAKSYKINSHTISSITTKCKVKVPSLSSNIDCNK